MISLRMCVVMAALAAAAGCGRGGRRALVNIPPPTVLEKPAVAAQAKAPESAAAPAVAATREEPAPVVATPRMPDQATKARIDELLARIEDAYFNYNEAQLRDDAQRTMKSNSVQLRDILRNYPEYPVTIEGHCDERGSAEFNMALGDRRAVAAKDYLVDVGIPAEQLKVVSFGKERPVCAEHDEACWQRNRRVHIYAGTR